MKTVVAFQGELGAYSEQACRQYFGADVSTLPCPDFGAMFQAAHQRRVTHVMLPVENSLAGTVIPAYDELLDQDLRIQGEEIVKVEHCLMAPKGVTLSEITHALSHPQALAQCDATLRRMGITPVSHYDTAGAARELAENPTPNTAAIASKLAATAYGLDILARDLQDLPHNYTRFFVLNRADPPRQDPSKTSIVFITRHVPGALYKVIGELVERGINLTKIESRPRRNVPWSYRFFVDFEGHEDDQHVREAMMGILKTASFVKVLGSYPAKELPLR